MTDDRGAASTLLLAVALATALLGAGLAAVGQYVAARLQAENAADAAALAAAPVTFRPYGAAGRPSDEAARLAAANGARLLACRCPVDRSFRPRKVWVRVRRQVTVLVFGTVAVTAEARAEFSPPRLFDGGSGY